MTIFHLPDLGEGLAEAEIHEWRVNIGEEVKTDQLIVLVETAKAIVEVPSPCNGKVVKLYAKAGETVKTGAPLIGFAATETAATVAGQLETSNYVLQENAVGVNVMNASSSSIKALPAARALAKKLNIDLTLIYGTGPQGQITVIDVENARGHNSSSWLAQAEKLHGVRKHMAQLMEKSHTEIVPVTVFDKANISAWKEKTDITARVIRAICLACQQEPTLNAWYDGKEFARLLHADVQLGLAVDTEDGLFVPVIKQANKLTEKEIRQQINYLKAAVTDRTAKPEELQGATITLSNFGTFAGQFATPIVIPPMVAIIATGKIYENASMKDKVTYKSLPLSLTFDHRAVTGGEATRFLGLILNDLAKSE